MITSAVLTADFIGFGMLAGSMVVVAGAEKFLPGKYAWVTKVVAGVVIAGYLYSIVSTAGASFLFL